MLNKVLINSVKPLKRWRKLWAVRHRRWSMLSRETAKLVSLLSSFDLPTTHSITYSDKKIDDAKQHGTLFFLIANRTPILFVFSIIQVTKRRTISAMPQTKRKIVRVTPVEIKARRAIEQAVLHRPLPVAMEAPAPRTTATVDKLPQTKSKKKPANSLTKLNRP